MKIVRTIALLTTTIVIIGILFIPRKLLFESYIGIIMGVVYLISFTTALYVILLYGDTEVKTGLKHREKPIGLLSLADALVFIIVLFFVADYQNSIPLYAIIITAGSMGIFIIYFLFAYLFNYVIIEEDGLRINYFLMMKQRYVKYTEIDHISFGMLMNTFKLEVNGSLVFIDVFVQNADKVLNKIYENTPDEIHSSAFNNLATFCKIFLMKSNLKYLRYFDQ